MCQVIISCRCCCCLHALKASTSNVHRHDMLKDFNKLSELSRDIQLASYAVQIRPLEET